MSSFDRSARVSHFPYNGEVEDSNDRLASRNTSRSLHGWGEPHLHANTTTTRFRAQITALIVVIALCLGTSGATAGPYKEGDYIEITGTVSDPNGMPIPDIHVIFAATKKSFDVSKFKDTTRDEVRQTVQADPHGQFTFKWRWVEYYNRYQVFAGVPRRSAVGESFKILSQLDLSKRIRKGSPVVVSLIVQDDEFLNSLRDFLASVDTDDEKQIYNEMGNPDRVQRIEHPTHDEISWWYFQAGKAYRFRDGELLQVVDFDPVTPFGT